MSLRTILVLVLAVVCGGFAALGVLLLQTPGSKADTVEVVVASTEIARGQLVLGSMVTTRPWPREIEPPGAVRELPVVVGRTALSPIVAGEPVLSGKLADRDAGRGLAALIPDGRRAYTIQTTRVASNVAGFVLPGNRVDVLLTLRGVSSDSTGGGSSTTLLQAVEILAVDQQLDAPTSQVQSAPQHLRSVTLLVNPDQASLLDLGQNTGTLSLSLRNPEDLAEAETAPATVNVLRFTQQEPADSENMSQSPGWVQRSAETWIRESVKWMAAAAVALPGAGSLPTDENYQSEPRFVEIQTLRGRHSGRILVRSDR